MRLKLPNWRVILVTAVVAATGCAGGGAATQSAGGGRGDKNLVSVLASTSTPDDSRKAADQRLIESRGKPDETRLAILEQILFAPGHSDAMRIYAMDQLADADAARAGKALVLYLPRMEGEHGEVLAHACDWAVKLGDTRVIDALITSMTRAIDAGTPLDDRPEVAAIETLSGKKLDDVLLSVLQKSPAESLRVAALDLLVVRMGQDRVMLQIAAMEPGEDAWLSDLQKYVGAFRQVPHGASEVTWARQLRRPQNAAQLTAIIKRHELLRRQPDYVFAPRFAGILAYGDDASAAMTRAELLADLRRRLVGLQHIKREASYAGAPEDIDESLDANEKKLSRCDLLTIRFILISLEDLVIINLMQQQGMDDLGDTTTEHGGLLAVKDGKIVLKLYPAMYAENDFTYVTGDLLLRETITGIAQYHYHFQQIHNEQRAGPGVGDLQYVKRTRCNAVVITSVGTRRMDVDYYTPEGAVVDLGVYLAE